MGICCRYLKSNMLVIVAIFVVMFIGGIEAKASSTDAFEDQLEYNDIIPIDDDGDGFVETKLFYQDLDLVGFLDSNEDGYYDFGGVADDGRITNVFLDSDGDKSFDQYIAIGEGFEQQIIEPSQMDDIIRIVYDSNSKEAVSFQLGTGTYEHLQYEEDHTITDIAIGVIGAAIIVLLMTFFRVRALHILIVVTLLANPMYVEASGDEVYNDDGSINEVYFEENWDKYSTLTGNVDYDGKTLYARKIHDAQQDAIMSLERHSQLQFELGQVTASMDAIKTDKDDMAMDLKKNLLRCIIRLSIITGDVINSGSKAKGGLKKIYDLGQSGIIQSYEAIKIGMNLIPKLENEADAKKKKAIGTITSEIDNADTWITYLSTKSLSEAGLKFTADQLKSQMKALQDDKSLNLPKISDLSITDDDAKILKDQKLYLGAFDVVLVELTRQKVAIQEDMVTEEGLVEMILEDIDAYRDIEKENIRQLLIDAWKRNNEETSEPETDWLDGIESADSGDDTLIQVGDELIDPDEYTDEISYNPSGTWTGTVYVRDVVFIASGRDVTAKDKQEIAKIEAEFKGKEEAVTYNIVETDGKYYLIFGQEKYLFMRSLESNSVFFEIDRTFSDGSMQGNIDGYMTGIINDSRDHLEFGGTAVLDASDTNNNIYIKLLIDYSLDKSE